MARRKRDLTDRDREVRRLVGSNIRRVRKERGRSIEWLADEVDVSTQMMSRVELGQQVITTDLLDRVALALETTTLNLYRQAEPAMATG